MDALAARMRRQLTTAYPKPTDCAGVTSSMQSVQDLLDKNPSKALAIINVIKTLKSADVTCSADEIASLKSMKTAAKGKATLAVNKFTNAIAAAVTKFNAAVEALQAINAKLTVLGVSTVAAGTQAPAVATVFVPTEAATTQRTTGTGTTVASVTGTLGAGETPKPMGMLTSTVKPPTTGWSSTGETPKAMCILGSTLALTTLAGMGATTAWSGDGETPKPMGA